MLLSIAVATLLGVLASAFAQPDISADPNYGTASLGSGFTPDPYRIDVMSGGPVAASSADPSCTGYVTTSPDYRLIWSGGGDRLRISFAGDGDTTLVVNGPDGNWYCNDDYEGLNPLVEFAPAQNGRYDIWVGSFTSGSYVPGQLSISGPSVTANAAPPQPPGSGPLGPEQIEALVASHNSWRARYGTPPVTWSAEVAAQAQSWAEVLAARGELVHSGDGRYGENLYWTSGSATGVEVVDAWASESRVYNYEANNWWPDAGHWSQVVWSTTTEIGCGVARSSTGEVWVCNYSPPGNISGQRPY